MRIPHAFFLIIALSLCGCTTQTKEEVAHDEPEALPTLTFYTNKSVTNAEEENEKQVIDLWKDYLNSKSFQRPDGEHWSYEDSPRPDQFLFRLQIFLTKPSNQKLQCNIIGVYPVEHDHYALKSMFTMVDDTTQQVDLKNIITVYAKKINGEYKLVNSLTYNKLVLESKSIGDITYYIHPRHNFQSSDAKKMDTYNTKLAAIYEMDPLKVKYFVCNNTRDLSHLMGMDFMEYSYKPVQTGGMAETTNNTILAGNNSSYYPHELVHLYTYNRFGYNAHSWFDEGIAAYYGGSSGYTLEWHLDKLKSFLAQEPDYDISDLTALQVDIPNGEYMTDFRYAIGGLICKLIIEKHGQKAIWEALQSGRSEEAYFSFLKQKLGVDREDFGDFVKSTVASLSDLNPDNIYVR